ncbi:MAG: carboxypeptidase-like regulatory domain-containing protein [Cyanobacteria bacterium P01_D01_bin.56]
MVTQPGGSIFGLKYWQKRHWQKQLRRVLPVLSGVGIALLFSQPGWSHGAIATVTHTFAIEASYSSGEPMAQAQVVVYSPDDLTEPWATGQTDEQGKFEFDPDKAGDWEVVIRQAGHGTTVSVPVGTTMVAQTPGTPAVSTASTSASPLHRWASAGAGLWGLVGTVLFFSRGKQSS